MQAIRLDSLRIIEDDEQMAIQDALERLLAETYARIPRRRGVAPLQGVCKLVAHRGCHDGNRKIKENSMEAFQCALQAGVWAIELDLQFTRDGCPVVLHDADGGRIWGDASLRPAELSRAEMRQRCPEVPFLEEVLGAFREGLHFMIEVKRQTYEPRYNAKLRKILQGLVPERDFHLLALHPETMAQLRCWPRQCKVLVAETNTRYIARQVLAHGYGGMAGHFLLLGRRLRLRLRRQGIKVGAGFVDSENGFKREWQLETDWLFSNRAELLAGYRRGWAGTDGAAAKAP